MSGFTQSEGFDLLFIFPFVSCFNWSGVGGVDDVNEDTHLRCLGEGKDGGKGRGFSVASWASVSAWNVCGQKHGVHL